MKATEMRMNWSEFIFGTWCFRLSSSIRRVFDADELVSTKMVMWGFCFWMKWSFSPAHQPLPMMHAQIKLSVYHFLISTKLHLNTWIDGIFIVPQHKCIRFCTSRTNEQLMKWKIIAKFVQIFDFVGFEFADLIIEKLALFWFICKWVV